MRGPVSYCGPLPPGDPPLRVPPPQRPLSPWQAAALDVLYERPSPAGPPPIALERPRAVYAEGRGPVIQVLPGDLVFAEHLPQVARTAMPAKGPFSNHVVRLPGGRVRSVPPSAGLPTPGGYLHVMWEQAEWRDGTPHEIERSSPRLGLPMPTLVLRAVPYLRWSDTTIHTQAGTRYRLVLQNDDPTSAHAMHLHMTSGHGHGGGGHGGAQGGDGQQGECVR
ncbi:MAG: hypothetical protein KY464_06250 [Gemmatimonadetes bacterium]|nr:hypothetical protein [Gemmatimonadota bacterium]